MIAVGMSYGQMLCSRGSALGSARPSGLGSMQGLDAAIRET